jgi:DedD protein
VTSAKTIETSAAEQTLKRRGRRRLIGALTLGIVAIVFLPMVFDSEPKRQSAGKQEIAIQIPPKEGLAPLAAPVAPKQSPLPAETSPPTLPPSVSTATPAVAANETKAAAAKPPATKPAEKTNEKSASTAINSASVPIVPPQPNAKAAEKPPANVAATKAGFVVQLGAYKDADNAKAIVARMKEANLPVFTDVLAVKTGNVTRVRVGPYPTKDQAESALAQVKLAGADGKVVATP